jgi:hypothetical protein
VCQWMHNHNNVLLLACTMSILHHDESGFIGSGFRSVIMQVGAKFTSSILTHVDNIARLLINNNIIVTVYGMQPLIEVIVCGCKQFLIINEPSI